jgi:hypothetical protein
MSRKLYQGKRAESIRFAFEVKQIDEYGRRQNQHAFAGWKRRVRKLDEKNVLVGKRFIEKTRPLLLDHCHIAVLSRESEGPKLEKGRLDFEQYHPAFVLNVELFSKNRKSLLNCAQKPSRRVANFDALEEPSKGMMRHKDDLPLEIEKMNVKSPPMTEILAHDETENPFSLFCCEQNGAHLGIQNLVFVSRLITEKLSDFSDLVYEELLVIHKFEFGHCDHLAMRDSRCQRGE